MKIVVRNSEDDILFVYNSSIAPRKDEYIYGPHIGKFFVIRVLHFIFDDAPDDDENKEGWVDVMVTDRV